MIAVRSRPEAVCDPISDSINLQDLIEQARRLLAVEMNMARYLVLRRAIVDAEAELDTTHYPYGRSKS